MQWELLVFAAVFVSAVLLLRQQCRSVSALMGLGGAALLLIGSAFGWQRHLQKTEAVRREFRAKIPHTQVDEYVSSANCRSCHPDQYASWHRSYHRTMTQLPTPENVRGKFDNLVLQYDGDDHRLERRGNEFWVETVDPDWKLVFALKKRDFENGVLKSPPVRPEHPPKIWRQIDMLTGSHHMQACWVAGEFGNQQFIFPFIYLFEDQRWVPREEAFLKDPTADKMVQVWNGSCIRCHATAGKPLQDPRTSIFQTEVAELGIACEACHGPAYQHVQKNRDPKRRYALHNHDKGDPTIVNPKRLDSKRSSEVCGHCHGVKYIRDQDDWMAHGFRFRPGGKLDDDGPITMRLAKIAQDLRFPEPVRKNPELLYGTFWPDGMIRVSGREYAGLLETPCFQRGEMSCLSCHSMHQSDPDDQLAANMDGNQACLQCHNKFRIPSSPSPLNGLRANASAKDNSISAGVRGETMLASTNPLTAHTHHAANSSGSSCYNCHMPHTTYGLLKAIRSHEISSPSVANTLKSGRPNACNLCHLDKSLDWAATHLNEWYRIPKPTLGEEEQNTAASVTWVLRGDANQRALVANTLKSGRPNACNLCHLDKSLDWAATHLNEWYRIPKPTLGEEEQNTAASIAWALRGDAGQRALVAWHMGWKPALEISGTDWMPFYLTQLLTDPYSAVRYVAKRSLKHFSGFEKLDYDYLGSEDQRRAVQQKCFALAKPPPRPNPSLLFNSDGTWQTNKISSVLARRDDHYMELLE